MEALQAACLAVHAPPSGPDGERRRAEAEAVLEHFKRSPSALPDAMALLRARDPPALPVVQFHCVATVREVTLKKWPLLGVQDKAQALDFLMQMLYERYAELPRFVAGAALQTVVLLMKRGWLDRAQPERDAIIQQMGQMLLAQSDSGVVNSVTTRLIAAKWLLAFVTEFSSASRASAMHQPIEFHTKTRRVLEKQGLKELLGFAILLLEDSIRSTTMSTAGPAEGGAAEVPAEQLELLETAFLLCIEILNWNFVDNRAGNLAWSLSSSLDKGDESRPVITPQESWRPVLVRPELIHSAFNTYAFFRNLGTKNETLLHLARQFLILLASLQGPIFARKEEQVSFLCETFRGVTEIIRHPFLDMISKTDYAGFEIATREMIDCCQLFFRLANNIGLKALVHAPAQMFQTFLEELSALSCKLLQSALHRIQRHLRTNPGDTVDDLWELEGVEVLLDAWVSLSADSLLDGSAEAPPNEVEAISAMISKYSSPVIQLYLQTQLELSAVEALAEQDEEEDVDDDSASGSREQFELAAALARMSAAETGALLLRLFETLMAGIQQALADLNGQDTMSPALSQLFEKLHFTILFAGLFLADDYAGERPSIPSRIHATMQGVPVSAEPPVIVKLIVLLMSQLVEFEASRIALNSASDTISPFVSEQLFSTITRLSATYLAPDTLNHEGEIAPALLSVFGYKKGGRAEELVHFLIQQSTTYLLHWPTQPVVMQNLMEFLLVLSNTRAISCVLGAPMWQTLVQANASAGTFITATAGADPLHVAVARIPCNLRGQLTEALCRAAMTSDNNDTKTLCFQSISRPVEGRLQQLIGLPHFESKQTTNDVRIQEELKLILELYSGIARSAESTSHGLIAGFSLPVLPVIVKIFHMFHGDSQIVTSILSFFCLLVEAQICYLTPRDALQVYSSCNELITGYCRHNLGKKSVLGDAEEESYADLLALLQLLSHLVSKDFIDFSDHTAEQAEVDHASSVVSDVVFSGLSRVIPLMTEQLLQYPSLSKQYFTLISYMVEVYAEKLSSLPTNLFGMLLHSLLFGMRHVQIEVVRYSFQAVGELASYHWKAQQKKEAGLETHRAANPDIFVHFIRCIFRMALFEDFNPVVLDYCASALYPLILIEQSRYFSIAEEISNEQPDPSSQQRLMAAFGELTQFVSAADIAMGTATTRKFRMQFKSNLYAFVADARGFIQMK